MKIAAIIAEFNPFHKGHRYLIENTRKSTGADYILILMSGNFVQRGAPALCNKYLRTRMALSCGADAVFELPALYALSSAEFFAGGAVKLLSQLDAVDFLSFGSEAGEIAPLMECAKTLLNPPEEYTPVIRRSLQKGASYPAAITAALPDNFRLLLSSPNNILGVEYCKALLAAGSRIRPFTLKRKDNGYHETNIPSSAEYASASAIRSALPSHLDIPADYMPAKAYALLKNSCFSGHPITEDDFSGLLHYRLLSEASPDFSAYLDCTGDLSDKIRRNIPYFTGFTDLCRRLKSRDLTYTRVSRVLMHILLDIRTPDFYESSLPERSLFTPYARLLGFCRHALPLLSELKRHSSIPLISKPADAFSQLDERARELFLQDCRCASVYESVVLDKIKIPPLNELKQSPVILP